MNSRYRVVDPIRFFIFIFICVCTIVFAGFAIVDNTSAQAASVSTYKQVVVQNNGSLWDIADDYCKSDMDIRDYIYDICEVNDIDANEYLQPGDVLFVPIY